MRPSGKKTQAESKARAAAAADAVARLRAGDAVGDKDFDLLLPSHVRAFSRTHWSSVAVAQRAAAMLVDKPERRVLDLGSGVGKFCIVGALTTDAAFTGVEVNPALVAIATTLVQTHSISNARFVADDALSFDWSRWDAFYLFNPFASAFEATQRGLNARPVAGDSHARLAALCRQRLNAMPAGTRVVLYWGFGAAMAAGWHFAETTTVAGESLDLWIKK